MILEPVLFNIFINNLDDETPGFADNAKLGEVIDGSNGLCCHSEGPRQAGEMGQQESNEVPQREVQKSCPWGGDNLMHQWMLGADGLKSSFAENELAVLVLNMSDVENQAASWAAEGSVLPLGRWCSFPSIQRR